VSSSDRKSYLIFLSICDNAQSGETSVLQAKWHAYWGEKKSVRASATKTTWETLSPLTEQTQAVPTTGHSSYAWHCQTNISQRSTNQETWGESFRQYESSVQCKTKSAQFEILFNLQYFTIAVFCIFRALRGKIHQSKCPNILQSK